VSQFYQVAIQPIMLSRL